MKKLIVLILIALCFFFLTSANANPFPSPCLQPVISEIYFSEPGTWALEVHFIYYYPGPMEFDSLIMYSQTSRVKIRSAAKESTSKNFYKLYYSGNYPDFYLDQFQDTITLVAHWSNDSGAQGTTTHSLAYGYPDCNIPVVYPGQSICCRIGEFGHPKDYFYKSNSPSIGAVNNFIDATATVAGKIYDMNGQLVTWVPDCHSLALKQNIESIFEPPYYTYYYFDVLGLTIDSAGNFTTEIPAHQSVLTRISHLIGDCHPNGATVVQDLPCAAVPFNFEPGDILDTDLHLTGNGFLVGLPVELPAQTKMSVVVAPNPFSDFTQLYLESDEGLSEVVVHIYNAAGSIVKTYLLPQGEKTMLTIRKSDLGAAGIYSYIVQRESNVLKSGKLVCN